MTVEIMFRIIGIACAFIVADILTKPLFQDDGEADPESPDESEESHEGFEYDRNG